MGTGGGRLSCSRGWPWVPCVVNKDDLQFLILQSSGITGTDRCLKPSSPSELCGSQPVLTSSLASTGRKREWFKIEDAIRVLQCHKPVQASYFEALRQGYSANNGTPVVPTTYSSSVSGIR